MTKEDNTLPPGGKILQFGKSQTGAPTPAADAVPAEKDFDFHFADGSVYQGTGFLIATSAFMGLGKADGEITFLVPNENLAFVEAVVPEDATTKQ